MGPDFTAKDFRTWAGTLICACALARVAENNPQLIADARRAGGSRLAQQERGAQEGRRGGEGDRRRAGEHAGGCKNSYIEPSVLSRFERGEVVEKYFDTVEELVENEKPTLAEPEKALKELLETSAETA